MSFKLAMLKERGKQAFFGVAGGGGQGKRSDIDK